MIAGLEKERQLLLQYPKTELWERQGIDKYLRLAKRERSFIMTILAVDDEKLLLLALENAIREAEPNAEVISFNKATDALMYAKNNPIDVAFLDIRMRGMDGMELAEKIMGIYPGINVIFCTGYDEYVSEAFRKIRCNGYITKPVDAQKVMQELRHLRKPLDMDTAKHVRFQCFGNFEAFVDEKPIKFERMKTKELLAYLVNANGAVCTNNEIIVNLWDDDENHDSYFKKLRMDLVTTLEKYDCLEIINRQRGGIGIVTELVDCDYYTWKKNNQTEYSGEYMKQYLWSSYWM